MRRLSHRPEDESPSDWSPDGRRILFTVFSRTAPRATVWTMHADGTHGQRLTHGSYDVAAAWSPDGTRILFTRIVPDANGERGIVMVMRADGKEIRALTLGMADEYATSWQAVR
jgi:Tol biopolymer transport system component